MFVKFWLRRGASSLCAPNEVGYARYKVGCAHYEDYYKIINYLTFYYKITGKFY